jgi:CheY-like chemotaxis protein
VLVIGDDGGAPRILRRLLDVQDVVTASDGRRALAILEKDADFDLLLCDPVMPDPTGVEFWSEVVFKHPALIDRIVFVTHGAQSTGDEAFLSSGAVQVLREPYSLESLRRLIAEHVEGAVASW